MANGWYRGRNPAKRRAASRKYNSPEHRAARKRYAVLVEAGHAYCWRPDCQQWIPPGTSWHVGHDDIDTTLIRGPEHERCNLHAAAVKGARTRNQPPPTTRLTW